MKLFQNSKHVFAAALLTAALFFPALAAAQNSADPAWGSLVPSSPVAGNAATTSSTITVDLRTAPGLTDLSDNQFENLINRGNLYYRITVVSDGTVNGAANFRFSGDSAGSALATTAATTGAVIQEGGVLIVRATGRYFHRAGIGSDTDHTIAVTRVVPFVPN